MEIANELLLITKRIGEQKTVKELEAYLGTLSFLMANNGLITRLVDKRRKQLAK